MSAETLRKAAEKLRDLCADSQPTPWETDISRGSWFVCDANGFEVARTRLGTQPEAAYIATMHPGVGLALADWLEFVWKMGEPGRKSGLTGEAYDTAQALAVARLILGGAS